MTGVSTTIDRQLPPSERDAIRQAVAETELETSAEIVVFVVAESDDYAEAVWRAAVTVAALAGMIAALWQLLELRLDPASFAVDSLRFLWLVGGGGVVGALLAWCVPRLKVAFVPQARRSQRVRERAERAFAQEGVASTRGRTGVLILVSLLERIVRVQPDLGVGETVPEAQWHALTDRVAAAVRAGRLGPGLCEVVRDCGELLREHGLTRPSDDVNELDDRVRLE